jgi:hypothetical protein
MAVAFELSSSMDPFGVLTFILMIRTTPPPFSVLNSVFVLLLQSSKPILSSSIYMEPPLNVTSSQQLSLPSQLEKGMVRNQRNQQNILWLLCLIGQEGIFTPGQAEVILMSLTLKHERYFPTYTEFFLFKLTFLFKIIVGKIISSMHRSNQTYSIFLSRS